MLDTNRGDTIIDVLNEYYGPGFTAGQSVAGSGLTINGRSVSGTGDKWYGLDPSTRSLIIDFGVRTQK